MIRITLITMIIISLLYVVVIIYIYICVCVLFSSYVLLHVYWPLDTNT